MTSKPSQTKIDELRQHFDFFDEDTSGQLEFNEFIKLLKVIEPTSTLKQAEDGFKLIDDDHNGTIDFKEFITWWESYWWNY